MKYKLDELIESISDTRKINKDKVILINTSDVGDGLVLNHKYIKNQNLKGQFKKRFKKGDILYSEIRPQNKRFAYIDFDSEDYIASTKLMVLRRKNQLIDNDYLFYVLKSNTIINRLQILAELRSGTFPQITFDELKRIEIDVPKLKEQTKIVKILKNIEDKIKLNNHTNDNLFNIGLELLKEDFNRKTDYEVLSNAIKFVKGKKPLDITLERKPEYIKYLTIACLNGQELNYADPTKMILSNNDLLMVMDGASSGDVYYGGQGIVGSTLSRVDCIDDNYISEFIYFIMKYYKDLIQSKNTGSAIPHTDKVFVGTLKVPKLLIEEQEKYKTLLYKILQNMNENKILEQLRNTLLTKFMNGEIDLDKIEI